MRSETVIAAQITEESLMRTLQILGIVPLFLMAAGPALADRELCDSVKRCEHGCYASNSRVIDVQATSSPILAGACDLDLEGSSEYISFQLPLNWAPEPAILDCASSPGHQSCEAWPEGDSITYSWSTTGGFQSTGGTAANPFRTFSCTSGATGTITVTAYSPQGAASSVSTVVSCP